MRGTPAIILLLSGSNALTPTSPNYTDYATGVTNICAYIIMCLHSKLIN